MFILLNCYLIVLLLVHFYVDPTQLYTYETMNQECVELKYDGKKLYITKLMQH